MRKNILRPLVLSAVFFVVILSSEHICDSSYPVKKSSAGVYKYTHTQRRIIDFSHYNAYRDFLKGSGRKFVIPGLCEGFVPQGITYCEKEKSFMISGYNAKSGNAHILSVDSESERLNGEYKILKSDGSEFSGHSGGIASYGRYIYITDGYILYCMESVNFDGGSKKVKICGEVTLPCSASFLCIYDGYLWAGNFYHGTYSNSFDISATDSYGKVYKTAAIGYRLDAKYSCGIKTSKKIAVPYLAIFAPNEVQGMSFLPGGDICISCSYGRDVMSTYMFFSNAFKREADSEITVGKIQIPVWFLNNDSLNCFMTAPPMSEGITEHNGNIYAVFESASVKYSESAIDPTDCVWEIKG